MRIATWNVLHRIHAENWGEMAADVSEAARIAAITARVTALFAAAAAADDDDGDDDDDDVVVCLQEVSGDQLLSLRAALPALSICSFVYPRVPSLKQGGPSPLHHPEESLVTLSARGRLVAGAAYDSDPGKGFVVVDVDGVVVVNTHLSAGDRRASQLAHLKAHVDRHATVVVCGDCNTSSANMLAGLADFVVVDLGRNALPTRPRSEGAAVPSDKRGAIDHILLRGLRAAEGVVVDVDGASDHNLVQATVSR